jgi:acyl carrier protein
MKNISDIIIDTIKKENFGIENDSYSSETELFGGKSSLDSLGLVTLIVALEQNIEDELGIAITIADEKAMSLKNSPFRTISSLEKFLIDKISSDE